MDKLSRKKPKHETTRNSGKTADGASVQCRSAIADCKQPSRLGLCQRCYQACYRAVAAKEVTWAQLEERGVTKRRYSLRNTIIRSRKK
jgi:hypothetical protein